jgi:DNA invertase Pin-like site-specific DNA recombinase
MKFAIYARVSKGHFQDPETQLLPLREWAQRNPQHEVVGLKGEYVDRISSRDVRPKKEDVLGKARVGVIQGIVVYRLDRWARNVSELARDLEELHERGVTFISLHEQLAFDRATDRAMLHMVMTFAELERDLIQERTLDGLKRARAQGKIPGRHPVGCGCGHRGEDGSVHDGDIKPVRDEHNRHVGWLFPDGRQESVGKARTRSREKKSAPPQQTPPAQPPSPTP